MCSDVCPCTYDNYNSGEWDSLTAEELGIYGRSPRLSAESNKLTTDLDAPSWESLNLQTQKMLTDAGYSELPPSVTNYEQCFSQIVKTDAYKE